MIEAAMITRGQGALFIGMVLAVSIGALSATQAEAAPQQRDPPAVRTVAEVEQLFDRYVLGQARQALQLDQEQARQFAPRLHRLQALRRRALQQQRALVRDLSELTRAETPADERVLVARMRQLDDQAGRAERAVRAAYAELEQVLTVEQRARLRVFEERMARRKLDLIAQARQQTAPGVGDGADNLR
jgi:hypothetical protein